MKGASMATIETLEADINKLKADINVVISEAETKLPTKAAEDSAEVGLREGNVKTIAPTENKDEVKTPSAKVGQAVSADKPKEDEAKAVVSPEDKDHAKTANATVDEPVSAAKLKEEETKAVGSPERMAQVKTVITKTDDTLFSPRPKEEEAKAAISTHEKAKDEIEKGKTGVAYLSKPKFWIVVCMAFLFGVAVGSFISTYVIRSSPPTSSRRSDEAATQPVLTSSTCQSWDSGWTQG
jgi:hypothetical protein